MSLSTSRIISFKPLKMRRWSVTLTGRTIWLGEVVIRGIKVRVYNHGPVRFTVDSEPPDQRVVRPVGGEYGVVEDLDSDKGAILHQSTFAGILWRWDGAYRRVWTVALSYSVATSSYRYRYGFEFSPDVKLLFVRRKRNSLIVREVKEAYRRGSKFIECGRFLDKIDATVLEDGKGVAELWEIASAL